MNYYQVIFWFILATVAFLSLKWDLEIQSHFIIKSRQLF